MGPTNIWSKRYSHARGWYWKHERECFLTSASDWLDVFMLDEPDVEFVISVKKPKVK